MYIFTLSTYKANLWSPFSYPLPHSLRTSFQNNPPTHTPHIYRSMAFLFLISRDEFLNWLSPHHSFSHICQQQNSAKLNLLPAALKWSAVNARISWAGNGKKYALAVSCGRRLGRDLFSKTTKNNGIRSLHVSVSRKSPKGCSCIAVDFDSKNLSR